jgi:hypothetical protein
MYRELSWDGCDNILQEGVSDKLFLFDCCHAASTASTEARGFSETICASGFESIPPRPGPHSFTSALVYVLRHLSRDPRGLSVASLYTSVLERLKDLDPTHIAPDGFRIANAFNHLYARPLMPGERKEEWRRTPVHFIRSENGRSPNIFLLPLPSVGLMPLAGGPAYSQQESNGPQAQICITMELRDPQNLTGRDAESARRWLRENPLPVENVSVDPRESGRGRQPLSHPDDIAERVAQQVLQDQQTERLVEAIRQSLPRPSTPLKESCQKIYIVMVRIMFVYLPLSFLYIYFSILVLEDWFGTLMFLQFSIALFMIFGVCIAWWERRWFAKVWNEDHHDPVDDNGLPLFNIPLLSGY